MPLPIAAPKITLAHKSTCTRPIKGGSMSQLTCSETDTSGCRVSHLVRKGLVSTTFGDPNPSTYSVTKPSEFAFLLLLFRGLLKTNRINLLNLGGWRLILLLVRCPKRSVHRLRVGVPWIILKRRGRVHGLRRHHRRSSRRVNRRRRRRERWRRRGRYIIVQYLDVVRGE